MQRPIRPPSSVSPEHDVSLGRLGEGRAALLGSRAMKAHEDAAIAAGLVDGITLMHRACDAIAHEIFQAWPHFADNRFRHHALILCGPGNNGGDGYGTASLLHKRGFRVTIMHDTQHVPMDAAARHMLARAKACTDVRFMALHRDSLDALPTRPALIIDALFGTGLVRGLHSETVRCLEQLSDWDIPVLAVDAPSGLCLDSGRPVDGFAVKADLTVTFHTAKPGHFLAQGPRHCGQLRVAPIGLPAHRSDAHLLAMPDREALTKLCSSAIEQHKYHRGHVLVISGPLGRSGAARLAARSALRVGAGLVTVAAPESAMPECAAQLTAIMLRRMDGATGFCELLEDPRLNAVVIGPGAGTGKKTRRLVKKLLAHDVPRHVVLDADALTAFVRKPERLFDAISNSVHDVVLTPHDGEFARLFSDLAKDHPATGDTQAFSRVDAAIEAARRSDATIVRKGHDSLIARPDAALIVPASYERAAPALATAGSGDCLAGIIAGLLASSRGDVAMAVWLHQELGRSLGPGAIAEDIPEQLPDVLRALSLRAAHPGSHSATCPQPERAPRKPQAPRRPLP